MQAALYKVRGAVQGVGFRPFVCRLARELGVHGSVRNTTEGAEIRAAADPAVLAVFVARVRNELPPPARIDSWIEGPLDASLPWTSFEIDISGGGGPVSASILPDLAPCPECLREMCDPGNRRYRHPFINCTRCGPRFSIVTALPYDRPNTTMRGFTMCAACTAEYSDPTNRRFHAQPIACPACGPRLILCDEQGRKLSQGDDAIRDATARLRAGRIVAMKGVGGFLLLADAANAAAVQALRERKKRDEKPFALMLPTLEGARSLVQIDEVEADLLTSIAAPVVLLRRRPDAVGIATNIAPDNPLLGIMLPSSPLHHLLMMEVQAPLVATSGNVSDEPICTDNEEAMARLRGIADDFLLHDRPIARPVDDSVARVIRGTTVLLRRARGYAPAPVTLPDLGRDDAALAVGAHLKNTVALRIGAEVFISQHLGDLETQASMDAFREAIAALSRLYPHPVSRVVADLHPDYMSTRHAHELSAAPLLVQHHVAHVVGGIVEHNLREPVLGVAWDGTGLGTDGTIWGGEFFLGTRERLRRVASLRPFRLPGGDAAVREPRRAALGLLHAHLGDDLLRRVPSIGNAFAPEELELLLQLLRKAFRSPVTTSIGRLFDAVAALTGLRTRTAFEGQSAMALEFASAAWTDDVRPYPLPAVRNGRCITLDWGPMLDAMLSDVSDRRPVGAVGRRFHLALGNAIAQVAERTGARSVVLTGGCFQNALLLDLTAERLQAAGCRAYWPQRVPPNDGGVSFGQAACEAYGTVLEE